MKNRHLLTIQRFTFCATRPMWTRRAASALSAGLFFSAVLSAQDSGTARALRVRGYVAPSGELSRTSCVLIRDGRIAEIRDEVPEGVPVDEFADAVACPGLIDASAALGVRDPIGETQTAEQPQARASDVFDRYSRQLRAALQAGVTTFALLPDDENLIGGRAAICRTGGPGGGPDFVSRDGPLKFSLSPEAFDLMREPTSRLGAVAMLRATLDAARQAEAGSDPLISAAIAGKIPVLFNAPSGADVLTALELKQTYGLNLTLMHEHDARAVAKLIADAGIPVLVGPLDLSDPPRRASAAAVLAAAGVRVAVAGGLPARPADSLRVGAAVAAQNGLDPAAARRAITAAPAEMLGIGDQVGSLQTGRWADVVIFSGDPLDLRSRVLAVYVRGERVYDAEPQ